MPKDAPIVLVDVKEHVVTLDFDFRISESDDLVTFHRPLTHYQTENYRKIGKIGQSVLNALFSIPGIRDATFSALVITFDVHDGLNVTYYVREAIDKIKSALSLTTLIVEPAIYEPK